MVGEVEKELEEEEVRAKNQGSKAERGTKKKWKKKEKGWSKKKEKIK